jgi:hypothetical protein
MKVYYLIPLLFLPACSTAPKLTLRPQQPPAKVSGVRYPEIIGAYHVGRYADPNDDLIMHERHTVYRVEENSRWDLHPNAGVSSTTIPRDAAFSPAPVNDDILAEVNSQRLATVEIMSQARTLSAALMQFQSALQQTRTNLQQAAALRATVAELKKRLDALESAQAQSAALPASNLSTTNANTNLLSP